MCLTNNHNLATLPRSRRRHFTLASPPTPRSAACTQTHTHTRACAHTHGPAVRLADTLITSEMPPVFYLIWPCLAATHSSERGTNTNSPPTCGSAAAGMWQGKLIRVDNDADDFGIVFSFFFFFCVRQSGSVASRDAVEIGRSDSNCLKNKKQKKNALIDEGLSLL